VSPISETRLFLLADASRLVLTRFEYVRRTAFLKVWSANLKMKSGKSMVPAVS